MLTLTQTANALTGPEARLAQESSRTLAHLESEGEAVVQIGIRFSGGELSEVSIPSSALSLFTSVLKQMGRGRGVAIVATDTELTSQQAADFMHVSRPYLVKLLDQGRIPCRKVGVRRRVRLEDLLRYMDEMSDAASSALDAMVLENQKLGLYP
jgi:excisionase family DNA binding protein